MVNLFKILIYHPIVSIIELVLLPIIVLTAALARLGGNKGNARLVWGEAGIINNHYWSKAMKLEGYSSETYTSGYPASINKRSDYDKLIQEHFRFLPFRLRCIAAFIQSLFSYDVFFISFKGYFLCHTVLRTLEPALLRLSKKKVVMLPFGIDAYIYNRIRSTSTIHVLNGLYPQISRQQDSIRSKVELWLKNADCVIPAFMGPDGIGRWDVIIPNMLFIDLERWKASVRTNMANGKDGFVNIVHTPNHRGFKGSEFLLEAVGRIKQQGHKVNLILIEKKQNEEVRKILNEEADILVEQLIFTGHGLSAIEGMASGIPVISNLEDDQYTKPVRRWSYFQECPLVSGSPENIEQVLLYLIQNPEVRRRIGQTSRQYAIKYHGLDSSHYLFENVIEFLFGRRESLMDLYHPWSSSHVLRFPKVETLLKDNKIDWNITDQYLAIGNHDQDSDLE